ncbi:hypothetical protein M422DRAFT_48914 [Sphaerobolus stellatus SS14]|uniref:Uncharacterized protein n=1 Tax=Sphaerobolus stellatus (strain SS14) TaxID=990650 RepID=A0A0C9VRF7_SPHS4|nr:hypothetical protein M422DRAFT_48914 [Sphaerobolus stellatus SS14]
MGCDYFCSSALTWLENKCINFLWTPLKKCAKWCYSLADIFLAEFPEYPLPDDKGVTLSLEDFRKNKFVRWFYNNAARRAAGITPNDDHHIQPSGTATEQTQHPKKQHPKGLAALGIYEQAHTARAIYGDDHKDTINNLASIRRAAKGQDHTAHAGIWNTILSEEWGKAEEGVKAHYEELGLTEKEQLEGPPNAAQLRSNQQRVLGALRNGLQELIGFEHGQIGDALIHVQLAYSNEDQVSSYSFLARPEASKTRAQELTTMADYNSQFSPKPDSKAVNPSATTLNIDNAPIVDKGLADEQTPATETVAGITVLPSKHGKKHKHDDATANNVGHTPLHKWTHSSTAATDASSSMAAAVLEEDNQDNILEESNSGKVSKQGRGIGQGGRGSRGQKAQQ